MIPPQPPNSSQLDEFLMCEHSKSQVKKKSRKFNQHNLTFATEKLLNDVYKKRNGFENLFLLFAAIIKVDWMK